MANGEATGLPQARQKRRSKERCRLLVSTQHPLLGLLIHLTLLILMTLWRPITTSTSKAKDARLDTHRARGALRRVSGVGPGQLPHMPRKVRAYASHRMGGPQPGGVIHSPRPEQGPLTMRRRLRHPTNECEERVWVVEP